MRGHGLGGGGLAEVAARVVERGAFPVHLLLLPQDVPRNTGARAQTPACSARTCPSLSSATHRLSSILSNIFSTLE